MSDMCVCVCERVCVCESVLYINMFSLPDSPHSSSLTRLYSECQHVTHAILGIPLAHSSSLSLSCTHALRLCVSVRTRTLVFAVCTQRPFTGPKRVLCARARAHHGPRGCNHVLCTNPRIRCPSEHVRCRVGVRQMRTTAKAHAAVHSAA